MDKIESLLGEDRSSIVEAYKDLKNLRNVRADEAEDLFVFESSFPFYKIDREVKDEFSFKYYSFYYLKLLKVLKKGENIQAADRIFAFMSPELIGLYRYVFYSTEKEQEFFNALAGLIIEQGNTAGHALESVNNEFKVFIKDTLADKIKKTDFEYNKDLANMAALLHNL